MKKYIIATIALAALTSLAADYVLPQGTTVPIQTTVIQEQLATTATVESLSVHLRGETPFYLIRLSLKDAQGNELSKKTVRLTHEQALAMMPKLDAILTGAQAAIAANINSLIE